MLQSSITVEIYILMLVLCCTLAAHPVSQKPTDQTPKLPGTKRKRPEHGSEKARSSSAEHNQEGLHCYKCDPTEFNNYCRDFKPNLAVPYECTDSGKPSKSSSPLSASVDHDKPFACYKIKGDAAYGHGKIYGAQRYGCGHVVKVRSVEVTTGDLECRNVRTPAKGKDFFDGIVCNCDNADGCNSVPALLPSVEVILIACYVWMINHRT